MSRQKLQLLVAMCQEIPDRLNVRSCSTRAVSCLNFKKVPELYSFLGPMQDVVDVVHKGLGQVRL